MPRALTGEQVESWWNAPRARGLLLSPGLTCGFREMHKDGVSRVRGPLRGERYAARGGVGEDHACWACGQDPRGPPAAQVLNLMLLDHPPSWHRGK